MEVSRATLSFVLMCAIGTGCKQSRSDSQNAPVFQSQEFHDYWHAGKAEISSYNLIQSRYGETRKGKAVMIFVTEDFSKKLQVKLDDPGRRNKVNVLKLNFTKNFITGIYPYSLMLSVFTPTDHERDPSSLKAAMSSQEWCGQIYTQLNLRGNRYAVKSHSYFEQEADEQFSVRQAFLEDEVWNLIRVDHTSLPSGEFDIIPGLFYTRLNHTGIGIHEATGETTETDSSFIYTLHFPEVERNLSISFEKQFPFKILGWRETWREKGQLMETHAALDETLYTDYWTKNKNEFLYLRDSLNLPSPY
jgi:hypothetical protein